MNNVHNEKDTIHEKMLKTFHINQNQDNPIGNTVKNRKLYWSKKYKKWNFSRICLYSLLANKFYIKNKL